MSRAPSKSLLPRPHHNTRTILMPPQQCQLGASKERQIQLVLQALKQDANLSLQCAAAIYKVPQNTLSNQRARQPSRANSIGNSRKLDNNEEQVIIDHVLVTSQDSTSATLKMISTLSTEQWVTSATLSKISTLLRQKGTTTYRAAVGG